MIKLENEIGKKYGNLTIIEVIYSKGINSVVNCVCDCGNKTKENLSYIRYGVGTHCGCKRRKRKNTIYKTGTKLYTAWYNMLSRCTKESNKDYKYYKAKGIKVCDEWLNYDNFALWAYANGYNDNLTIDRVDNNGNYEPSNCRWVDMKTQSINKSNTRYITYKGQTKSMKEWSEHLNIPYKKLQYRISQSNMSIEQAFNKP